MNTTIKPDWTPRLQDNGRVYCSPACGMKCTKERHDAAQLAAAALAKRMGPDWVPRVWENGLWHYSAVHKTAPINIHPSARRWEERRDHEEGVDEYSVYLNTNPQFITRGTDPNQALLEAVAQLDDHIGGLQATWYAITRPIQERADGESHAG
jgi:hypothetical protein